MSDLERRLNDSRCAANGTPQTQAAQHRTNYVALSFHNSLTAIIGIKNAKGKIKKAKGREKALQL